MDKRVKVVISLGILAFLVIAFWFASKTITAVTGKSILGWLIKEKTENTQDFSRCLSEKGVKMYGAYTCFHCQNEKDLFNNSEFFLDNIYVECDSGGENPNTVLCYQKGIEGYPTWEINGKLYPGEMSFQKLAELSGCKLE